MNGVENFTDDLVFSLDRVLENKCVAAWLFGNASSTFEHTTDSAITEEYNHLFRVVHDHQSTISSLDDSSSTDVGSYSYEFLLHDAQTSHRSCDFAHITLRCIHYKQGDDMMFSILSGVPPMFAFIGARGISSVEPIKALTLIQSNNVTFALSFQTADGAWGLCVLRRSLTNDDPVKKSVFYFHQMPSSLIGLDIQEGVIISELPDCSFCLWRQTPCSCPPSFIRRNRFAQQDNNHQEPLAVWKWLLATYTGNLRKEQYKRCLPMSLGIPQEQCKGRISNVEPSMPASPILPSKKSPSHSSTKSPETRRKLDGFPFPSRKSVYGYRDSFDMNEERDAALAALRELAQRDREGQSVDHSVPLCQLCGLSFRRQCDLRRHLKTVHCPDRPYVCELCKNQFQRRSHLHTHMQVHSKSLVSCIECNKAFPSQNKLNRHVRLEHMEVDL